jgi:phage terminase small subunit
LPRNGLTIKQEVFVGEYLIDGNSARAAIAAGYSKRSAGALASQLLANPKVAKAIYTKHMKRADKFDISAERVLEGLGNLAFFDIRKLYKEDGSLKAVTELDDVTAQAICGIEIEKCLSGSAEGRRSPTGTCSRRSNWPTEASISSV